MRLVTHISSVWNDICGYDAIPVWYEMTIVGMMTYQGVWNDMFWYETTLVYNDMYWYEMIPLRYELTCVGMNWYLCGMKWQLLVWWHTKEYEMKLIWYEMTIWWYDDIPFLDRVWWHTIWYEFFECFFLMPRLVVSRSTCPSCFQRGDLDAPRRVVLQGWYHDANPTQLCAAPRHCATLEGLCAPHGSLASPVTQFTCCKKDS